jgi:hypothetical protein
MIKTVQAVVDAYGLKALSGSNGEMTVNEDVTAMAKGYKQGESLSFTATLKAAMTKSASATETNEVKDEVVIDVAVEATDNL